MARKNIQFFILIVFLQAILYFCKKSNVKRHVVQNLWLKMRIYGVRADENRMYYIYSRKSKYTGKGESIENQVEMCKEYLYSHVKDIEESDIVVYEDEGFSAKNLERPMFKRMIADSQKEKVDYIVCYRLDRISRNVSDFSSLITDLNDRNIAFVSIKEHFDISTPMGRAMMYIASVFAQLERETIAERIRDNMHKCKMKNPNGNTLDKAVCEEIKKLTADNSRFFEGLSNLKKELTLKTEDDENELSKISQALSNVEKEISTLVQALSGAQNTPAQKYITEKINRLDAEKTQLLQKKDELENLLNNQGLSQIEFDNVKKLALSFGRTFDAMDVEQKRKALRTLVNKIV